MADDGDFSGVGLAARGHRRAPDFGREEKIRERVDGGCPAGREIRGGAEFGDDGGADDAIAGMKLCAIVERGAAPAAFFEDAMRGDLERPDRGSGLRRAARVSRGLRERAMA